MYYVIHHVRQTTVNIFHSILDVVHLIGRNTFVENNDKPFLKKVKRNIE